MNDVETVVEHNKNIFVPDSDAIKEADIATKHLIYWPKYTNTGVGPGFFTISLLNLNSLICCMSPSLCQFITCKQ